MSYSDIVQVLSTLMSTDNSSRGSAEEYFSNQQNSNLTELLSTLLAIIGSSDEDLMIRSLAGILLRRTIDPTSPHGQQIDDNITSHMRSELMNIWARENNSVILRRLAHIIAQSASNGKWVDLIPSIVNHSSTITEVSPLLSSLNIIEIIADYCPDDILTHIPCLIAFLGQHLESDNNSVQIAAAKATGACIVSLEDDNARASFKPAVQPVITVLGNALTSGDELEATAIMEHLVTIAQQQPMFFKSTIDDVVSAMLTVASAEGLEFSTRAMALELMVTLTETAPALARRCKGLLGGLVPLAMGLMLEVEEEEDEWMAQEYATEGCGDDDNYAVGEEAIERAASGMGGRVVGPAVVEAVQQYATSPDSLRRRAAVAALTRLAEGSTALFKTSYLDTALTFLESTLQDSSPRVQYQTIQAIGRLAELYPGLVNTIVELFLTPLINLLDSQACDKVKGHAVSAMINICRPREDEHSGEATYAQPLSPEHLDALLSCLARNLETLSITIQPICLTLLGCVAQVSAEGFVPYYESFMPGVKAIMQNATGPQYVALRGKAMECVGLIGEAVGDETFESDAIEVMDILLTAMGDCEDDITFDAILPACARISHALGDKFEPYLAIVMEPLLRGAQQVIQFSMEDAEDGDAEGEVVHDEETGLESAVISLGAGVKKRVTLNTHAMQQKNQCARMLYEFASSLKGSLYSYLGPCFDASLAMVTDKHSSDIRSSASLAVSKLFEACIDATRRDLISSQHLNDAMMAALQKLVEAVEGEVNATSRVCAVEALRDTLQACFESGQEQPDGSRQNFLCSPDKQTAFAIIKGVLGCCQESVERRSEKARAFSENEGLEAEDESAYAEELEEEEDVLSTLVDAMGQLLKLHGSALMPFFDQHVAPKFASFLSTSQPQALQVVAICMIDDIIEFGGVEAHKYIPQTLDTFLANLSSDHPVLRQSSAYGIAQAIRFAPELCAGQLSEIVSALMDVVACDEAKEEENEGTTENALFALGLACMNPSLRAYEGWPADISEVSHMWLTALPLRADETEAKICSSMICDAIESNDIVIIGEEFSNLPEFLRIFSEIIASPTPLAIQETVDRIKSILGQLQSGSSFVRPDQLQSAYEMLPEHLQQALASIS